MERTPLKAIDPSANQETLRFLLGIVEIITYYCWIQVVASNFIIINPIQCCISNFFFFFQVVSSIQEVQTCTVRMLFSFGIESTELVIFCRKLILVLYLHLPRFGPVLNSCESANELPHLVKGGEIFSCLATPSLLVERICDSLTHSIALILTQKPFSSWKQKLSHSLCRNRYFTQKAKQLPWLRYDSMSGG